MYTLPLDKPIQIKRITHRKDIYITKESKEAAEEAGWDMYTMHKWYDAQPVLMNTLQGYTLAMFHNELGSKPPKMAWTADRLLCCNPQYLPKRLRLKHIYPNWIGQVCGDFNTKEG
jgi:hypothetical protein